MAKDGTLSYVCGNENTRMIKLNLSELRARLEYGTGKATINLSFSFLHLSVIHLNKLKNKLFRAT